MNVSRIFQTGVSRVLVCGTFLMVVAGTTLFAGETLTLTNAGKTGTGTTIGDLDEFTGAVGNWTILSTVGIDAGSPGAPNLDLSSLDEAKIANPGALTIVFTETGYTLSPLTLLYSYSSSFLDICPGTVGCPKNGKTTVSDTVSLLVNGKTVNNSTGVITPVNQGSGIDGMSATIKPGNNYSITLTEVITDTNGLGENKAGMGGTEVSSDDLVGAQTPEPGLYALTGVGLVGLLALVNRRRKLQAAE